MQFAYVIVGAGLTGAVVARNLVDAGESVIVLDRRCCVGGNVADAAHPSGIRFHHYGPHLFRTVSDQIWAFVNRFVVFHTYRHQIKTRVDGALENWPIAASYIRRLCGDDWKPELNGNARALNFEEAALGQMPRLIYEKFVKGYTEKQWGVPARTLSPALCRRFDVRQDDDPHLHPRHKYQGIPTEGYSRMLERMLEGIPVITNFDYLADRDLFKPRKRLVFTGPIDEFFSFELGRLAYRAQSRETTYHPDCDQLQPCAQVNEPGDPPHLRDIEWKHLMRPDYASRIRGTLVTRETPYTPADPDQFEYPFPDTQNQDLYEKYRAMAQSEANVVICGRLGEYRYYDMDQAIGRATALTKQILGVSNECGDR